MFIAFSWTDVYNYWSQLLFTTYAHNLCLPPWFTTFVQNFGSNLLVTTLFNISSQLFLKTFFTNFVRIFSSNSLLTTYAHTFWLHIGSQHLVKNSHSQLWFKTIFDNFWSNILFSAFVQNFYSKLFLFFSCEGWQL